MNEQRKKGRGKGERKSGWVDESMEEKKKGGNKGKKEEKTDRWKERGREEERWLEG